MSAQVPDPGGAEETLLRFRQFVSERPADTVPMWSCTQMGIVFAAYDSVVAQRDQARAALGQTRSTAIEMFVAFKDLHPWDERLIDWMAALPVPSDAALSGPTGTPEPADNKITWDYLRQSLAEAAGTTEETGQ
jgi:hypothetical protein